jgi:large subunit ribosomal protein L14e
MHFTVTTVQIDPIVIADVKNKWEKSSWGKKLIVQKRRASLNDFDRFKVMLAKIKVSIYTLEF